MTDTTTIEKVLTDNKKSVVRQRDGVGMYGLYFDFIIASKEGKLVRQERRFLIANLLCVYSRPRGTSRATWRVFKFESHDEARAALENNLTRYATNVTMFGDPLVVEMTASDVESVTKGEAPYGRHSGTQAMTRLFGKIDDDSWIAPGAAA